MASTDRSKTLFTCLLIALCFLTAFCSAKVIVENNNNNNNNNAEEGGVWQNYLEENEGENYFEGDIIPSLNRNAVPSSYRVWKNGVIPYVIDDDYFFLFKNKILSAMKDLEAKVRVGSKDCIKFVPWSGEGDHIHIINGKGCSSYVGCQHWGRQTVNLAAGLVTTCMTQGIIQHELMHALGFFHEQSRSDRDEYITINWENIKKGRSYNFNKQTSNNQHQPYDYGSLMHYGSKEFGVWGILGPKNTISPKKKGVKIGQRNGPSPIDIKEIRLLYKCIHA